MDPDMQPPFFSLSFLHQGGMSGERARERKKGGDRSERCHWMEKGKELLLLQYIEAGTDGRVSRRVLGFPTIEEDVEHS